MKGALCQAVFRVIADTQVLKSETIDTLRMFLGHSHSIGWQSYVYEVLCEVRHCIKPVEYASVDGHIRDCLGQVWTPRYVCVNVSFWVISGCM